MELRCFWLLSSLGPLETCQPLHDAPSYLSNKNIYNEMLMGDKTLAWWFMSDQHQKHGNNISQMNRERWESLSPFNCRAMVMAIDTWIDKLGMQKKSWKSSSLPNSRIMVIVTNTQTNRLGMQKRRQESLCFFNVFLIVVNMNLCLRSCNKT